MKVGDRIKVTNSKELGGCGLFKLSGRKGTILEDLTDSARKNKGYIVKFDEPYFDDEEWFIPEDAVIKV